MQRGDRSLHETDGPRFGVVEHPHQCDQPGFYSGNAVKKMDEGILLRSDPADFSSPILRQGTPQDIANAALFLASEQSGFMTGQTIAVDGGTSIQARPFSKDGKPAVTPESWKAKNHQ